MDIKTVSIFSVLLTVGWFLSKPFAEAAFAKLAGIYTAGFADKVSAKWDDWTCGGRLAMAEGDRLSQAAVKDLASAQQVFREANEHYEKAYGCGQQDAGIRLAFAHCKGLGAAKDEIKARGIALQIERDHPQMAGRVSDLRKACGL